MLGFLLRLLPYWVREPLLIVLGSVLGVRLVHLAVRDQDPVMAGLGAVFLVFTAIRVHAVRRALRARRDPGPPVPEAEEAESEKAVDGAALAQAPSAPLPAPGTSEKQPHVWGQAVAAVAVVGALVAAVWVVPRVLPSSEDSASHPASCPAGEHKELPAAYKATPRAVSGDQLCTALNRPDLAQLLGTPGETATTASGTSNTAPLTGEKIASPEAEVRFGTYTVHLSATYNRLSVAQYGKLMKFGNERDLKTLTVLGRPATFSSDHTMAFKIAFGGGTSQAEQGPLARTLSVALDRKDEGGYYEVTVWSTTGALPDDSVLVGIAEKVLPTIPERAARQGAPMS
ncbi:DUF6215 domain-containing protein [Streptomyces sp. NPDC051597]|uniref:DUF6215 domain-containing protein n=1 Tax=Streptomyces sp. NPDC051597 TaxID=3155049 RepID=UPI00344376F5